MLVEKRTLKQLKLTMLVQKEIQEIIVIHQNKNRRKGFNKAMLEYPAVCAATLPS